LLRQGVVLFVDATTLRLFPPLRCAWAFRGQQAEVRVSGRNAKRVLFGAINPRTGHRLVVARRSMRQADFQAFLRHLRGHYPGRPLWLLLDRAPCHEALKSRQLAARLGIELLWLPKQCSELNAVDQGADYAERWFLGLTPRQALRKAGALSHAFWLKEFV